MKNIRCIECGSINNYGIKNSIRRYEGEGYNFKLEVQEAYCKQCGAAIWIDEIEEEISERANQKIREQRDIISKQEIIEIVNKYNASQKFLSRILGWGEITLTRYISGGYTPNSANSNKLRDLANPYVVQDLLDRKSAETDGEIRKEKSFKKMQTRVVEEMELLERNTGKIYEVVDWFLSQTSDENPITHLALQKLLYFSQSWTRILLGKWLFENDCQAWLHGAVYPDVYKMFKKFKYSPLPKVYKETNLSEQEIRVLKLIKAFYFDVYSAKSLESICHQEEPYKLARLDCRDNVCREIIKKENIANYYSKIAEAYNISMDNAEGIKLYLSDMV